MTSDLFDGKTRLRIYKRFDVKREENSSEFSEASLGDCRSGMKANERLSSTFWDDTDRKFTLEVKVRPLFDRWIECVYTRGRVSDRGEPV